MNEPRRSVAPGDVAPHEAEGACDETPEAHGESLAAAATEPGDAGDPSGGWYLRRSDFVKLAGVGLGGAATAFAVDALAGPSRSSAAPSKPTPTPTPTPTSTPAPSGGKDFIVTDYGAKGDGITDDRAAIQKAIDACAGAINGSSGAQVSGRVVFPTGTYKLASMTQQSFPPASYYDPATLTGHNYTALRLPDNLAGHMTVSGYGATILLTSGCPRFLDMLRSADHKTFRNISIEGFTVDGGGVTGGSNHVVVGNLINSTNNYWQNVENLQVRDIQVRNVPATAAGGGYRDIISLWASQMNGAHANNSTPTVIRHVVIENVRCTGGDELVKIVGGSQAPVLNSEIDDIVVKDCYHDTGFTYTAAKTGNNYHIGGSAKAGRVVVTNCQGLQNGDCGIEVNNATWAVVSDCYIEDTVNYSYLFRQFAPPLRAAQQNVVFDNCCSRRSPGTIGPSCGFVVDADGGPAIGKVSIVDSSADVDNTTMAGGVKLGRAMIRAFTLRNFRYRAVNGASSGASTAFCVPVWTDPVGPCNVTLDDIDVSISGARGGTGDLIYLCLRLEGLNAFYDVRNVRIEAVQTNAAPMYFHGLHVAKTSLAGASGSLQGRLDGITILSASEVTSAVNGWGVYVEGSSALTLDGPLAITNCDFRGLGLRGIDVAVGDAVNRRKVMQRGNAYTAGLPSAAAVALSGGSYENLDGYAETLSVVGLLVKRVTVTRPGGSSVSVVDGNDYGPVAQAVVLEPGDSITIDSTSTPTVKKIPLWW